MLSGFDFQEALAYSQVSFIRARSLTIKRIARSPSASAAWNPTRSNAAATLAAGRVSRWLLVQWGLLVTDTRALTIRPSARTSITLTVGLGPMTLDGSAHE
jgi:hypothetical protein